jgi:hypothetical protein
MTEQTQTTKKPNLEMNLESMEKIEDRVQQWMLLEEHWTQHNLNRHEQLNIAKQYFQTIIQEIKQAYKTCPSYSEV